MKRLEAPADEVWEIRSRDPRPGIRAFGRFALPDTFVLTNYAYRARMGQGDSKEWRNESLRCVAEWNRLFHPHEPWRGVTIDDYISANVQSPDRIP